MHRAHDLEGLKQVAKNSAHETNSRMTVASPQGRGLTLRRPEPIVKHASTSLKPNAGVNGGLEPKEEAILCHLSNRRPAFISEHELISLHFGIFDKPLNPPAFRRFVQGIGEKIDSRAGIFALRRDPLFGYGFPDP